MNTVDIAFGKLDTILENQKRLEDKIDDLLDRVKELPEQIEEYVVRIEDAARDVIGD